MRVGEIDLREIQERIKVRFPGIGTELAPLPESYPLYWVLYVYRDGFRKGSTRTIIVAQSILSRNLCSVVTPSPVEQKAGIGDGEGYAHPDEVFSRIEELIETGSDAGLTKGFEDCN